MNKIGVIGIALLLALDSAEPRSAQMQDDSYNHLMLKADGAMLHDWLQRWEQNILSENAMRYCKVEAGEEIGWLLSPFLKGFYNGYLATENALWVDRLIACTDAWLKRAVNEPDGYLGWPKTGAAGTEVDNLDSFYADSMLGEAMALTPIVLMATKIMNIPSLAEKYGSKADDYIKVAEQIFKKWDSRGAWRDADTGGAITVVSPFGIDQTTKNWMGEYDRRQMIQIGFSHPDNKANLIAVWLLAMSDATGKAIYRERAEKWFRTMKSRMKVRSDGTYTIWNYWEPAGVWDYKSNGLPKHWIGVHPKAVYYDIDVEGIVVAYEHGLIFNRDDINRLVKTAIKDKRYWTALVPFDDLIQKNFEESVDLNSWGALTTVPWYAAIQKAN
jgi:hypothetical protein